MVDSFNGRNYWCSMVLMCTIVLLMVFGSSDIFRICLYHRMIYYYAVYGFCAHKLPDNFLMFVLNSELKFFQSRVFQLL